MARVVVTTNELLDAIKAAREPDYPTAMTVKEICAALSLSRFQVEAILSKLSAKRVVVQRPNRDGHMRRATAYVLK